MEEIYKSYGYDIACLGAKHGLYADEPFEFLAEIISLLFDKKDPNAGLNFAYKLYLIQELAYDLNQKKSDICNDNSYGSGYALGEYEERKRIIHFIQTDEWPDW